MSIYPKKREKLSKKMSERIHSVRRASQRYGLEINKNVRRFIISSIQNRDGAFIRKISRTRTEWLVYVPGLECCDVRVIYDKKRKEIVTFLPL